MVIHRGRVKCDLSREELASKVGVSSEYIRLLEAEKRQPSRRTLSRIFKVIDVPVPDFDVVLQSRGRRQAIRTREDIFADLDKNMATRDRIFKKYWAASEKLADEWDSLMKELDNA